jgi:hypothetical protein
MLFDSIDLANTNNFAANLLKMKMNMKARQNAFVVHQSTKILYKFMLIYMLERC